MRWLAIACLVLCSGCTTSSKLDRDGPSFLNHEAGSLDGESVEAVGWMIMEGNEMALWDRKSDRDANKEPSRCVSLLVPTDAFDAIKPLSGSMVRIKGVFHKDVREFSKLMFNGLCNLSAIEVKHADAVRPAD